MTLRQTTGISSFAACLAGAVAFVGIAGQAHGQFTYVDRTVGTTHFLDITADDGGTTLFNMSLNQGRDDSHGYWAMGEIASFQDAGWGGSAFEYSPESTVSVAGKGMFRGGFLNYNYTELMRTATTYQFQNTTTYSGAPVTSVTTINAPTDIVMDGGQAGYKLTITTTNTLDNNTGGTLDVKGYTVEPLLAVNPGSYDTWPILNPIVSGQPYPNAHADDNTDGHELYEIVDWYGTETGEHNDGFTVKFTVKDNAETAALNMRPGAVFEITNSDISVNYANRTNNNIGGTSVGGNLGLVGQLTNARESHGFTLADGAQAVDTTTFTIFMPLAGPAFILGDMNDDGVIDNLDINPFVQALTDPAGYQTAFGLDPNDVGDINDDGVLDNLDINPFVALLTGPAAGTAVPEPASLALIGLGGLALLRRRSA